MQSAVVMQPRSHPPRRGSAHTVDLVALALARPPGDPRAARERQEHCFAVKAARAGTHQGPPPATSFVPAPRPDTSGDARMARDFHVAQWCPASPTAWRLSSPSRPGTRFLWRPSRAIWLRAHPSSNTGRQRSLPDCLFPPPPRDSGWGEAAGQELHGAPITLSNPMGSPARARVSNLRNQSNRFLSLGSLKPRTRARRVSAGPLDFPRRVPAAV